MQLVHELASFSAANNSLVTIGVFDGVHLGHKFLITQLKQIARERNLRAIAITFDRHPQEVLEPKSPPLFLTDASEKANLLKKEGLDSVVVLTFNSELANLGAQDFLKLLQTHLRMQGLVIGPDFALGKNHEGNIAHLLKLGKVMGFSVSVIPPVKINGDIVSSTAIRETLAKGDMERVEKLMGHPFTLQGQVVHGKGRGMGLGFPTLNLDISPGQAVPADGVYVTLAHIKDLTLASVTNVGNNPTYGKNERTIETFILDYKADLYSQKIKIDFIKKIRDEIVFKHPQELSLQIEKDILTARSFLRQANTSNGH